MASLSGTINGYRVRLGRSTGLAVVAVAMGSVASGLAASTTEECASLVPIGDRRRGKGAFFSGCLSRSTTSNRGGCWSSLIEEESGCQTCIVQDSGSSTTSDEAATPATTQQQPTQWASSVFSTFFELELDVCPEIVAEIYGTPEGGIVSYDEVQSADCGGENDDPDNGENWLAFGTSCYAKSSFLDAATNWEDADTRCGEMGARLVSLESEEENDFVTQNLLWIGFLGEAYTGLQKSSADGTWSWRDSLADFPPGTFDANSSFQHWDEGLDASSSYEDSGASCLEILPYAPKAWNPFSCEVNKQYVCEKPAGSSDAALSLLADDDDNNNNNNNNNEVTLVSPETPSPTAPELLPLVEPTPAPATRPTTTPPAHSSEISPSTPPEGDIETLAPMAPTPNWSQDSTPPTTSPSPVGVTPQPPTATPSPSIPSEGGGGGTGSQNDTPAPLTATATDAAQTGPPTGLNPGVGSSTESPTGSPTASPTGSPTGSPTSRGGSGGDEDEDGCVERLAENDKMYLATYDMKVYDDVTACVEAAATTTTTTTESPDWCNSFDVGQECRSCWLSCAGARLFLADFSWLSEEMIAFCPGVSLSDYDDDCPNDDDNSTGRRRTLMDKFGSFFRRGGTDPRKAPSPPGNFLRHQQ